MVTGRRPAAGRAIADLDADATRPLQPRSTGLPAGGTEHGGGFVRDTALLDFC